MVFTDAGQLSRRSSGAQAGAWPRQLILVNHAGIPDAVRADKMPLELIDGLIEISLRGPYAPACEVARRLIEASKPGRIV